MEYKREYEKYLRERLNQMKSKEEKIAYLDGIEFNIEMCDRWVNKEFDEIDVVHKLQKELQ
jgi:hypothetical protein